MQILLSDEKIFCIDGIYGSQNQRTWTATRAKTYEKGGIEMKQKFHQIGRV